MSSPTRILVAALAVAALALTGCTPVTEEQPQVKREPLELTIGALLPQTGVLASFGPAAQAGVDLAVEDVNDADLGITIETETRDSGDNTTDIAVTGAEELIDLDSTVIIGALGDGVSKKVIDTITGAGVLQISPSNNSQDFTRYADDGLYWRTTPSCTLEGDAMGQQIASDGAKSLGIIYLAGYCEPGLPEAVAVGFQREGGEEVVSSMVEAGGTSFSAQVAEVVAAKPDAVVIVSPTGFPAAVPELVTAGYEGDSLYFVGLSIADHSADFPAGSLTGSKASMPGIDISKLDDFTDRLLDLNPALTDFSYAAEAYDAVVIAALGALAANDVDGRAIATHLQEVSGGSGKGTRATEFASAAQLILDGETVDYDGPSGPITFDEAGDPSGGVIGIYEYDAKNVFTRLD